MSKVFSICMSAWLAVAAASPAVADGPAGGWWSVDGYGTLGLVHSSEDRADYVPDRFRPDGPGRGGDWSMEVDSRAAVQLSVHPTSRLSAVVQAVTEQDHADEVDVHLEWANVRYEVTPRLAVRVGRIALDTYLVSDHRKVGYALPWVRPPPELYRVSSITSNDGVDIAYRRQLGDLVFRAHLAYGGSDTDDVLGVIEARDYWGFSSGLDWGAITLHASYQSARVAIPANDAFFETVEEFGPEGEAVRERYDPTGKRMYFLSAGGRYDPGRWFVMGEWGYGDSRSITGAAEAWYVSAGYRLGTFTPYATFASVDRDNGVEMDGLTAAAYPPPFDTVAAALNAELALARRSTPVQTAWTLGARWDVVRNVAIKMQYDRVNVGQASPGLFRNVEPGYQPNEASLISIAVDFLF